MPAWHDGEALGGVLCPHRTGLQVGGERVGILLDEAEAVTHHSLWINRTRNRGILARNTRDISVDGVLISDTQPAPDGADGFGLRVESGASVEVRGSTFLRNHKAGAIAAGVGSHLSLTDVLTTDTQPEQISLSFGRALQMQEGASVEVTRAAFVRNRGMGAIAVGEGTEATLTDIFIADTLVDLSDNKGGVGFIVALGASAQVERGAFVRNRDIGVLSDSGGAHAVLKDVLVADTQPQQSDEDFGNGITVNDKSSAVMERVSFVRNHMIGISIVGEGTTATLADVFIADTQLSPLEGKFGRGLQIQDGAVVALSRAAILRNHSAGILVGLNGARLTMADVVVADTESDNSEESTGIGVLAQVEGLIDAERVSFLRNKQVGVLVRDEGSVVSLTDVLVKDTGSRNDEGFFETGMTVVFGASVEVVRGAFLDNRRYGVGVENVGSRLTLKDVVVADTLPIRVSQDFGLGLMVRDGASAHAERAAFLRNHQIGVFISDEDTSLVMADIIVADTQPTAEQTRFGGRGLQGQQGASVEAERISFVRNHLVSVVSVHEGTDMTLTDLEIRQTLPVMLPETGELMGGTGIAVVIEGRAELARFSIEDNDLAGILLATEGTLRATDGEVLSNFVGVNVQDTTEPLGESLVRVDVRNNCCGDCSLQTCNIDSKDLPVPGASEVLESLEP